MDFKRLSLSDCNTILKLVHPDVNSLPEAKELTIEIIKVREQVKKRTKVCLECNKPVDKPIRRFCSQQCCAYYNHRIKKRKAIADGI